MWKRIWFIVVLSCEVRGAMTCYCTRFQYIGLNSHTHQIGLNRVVFFNQEHSHAIS